MNAIQNVNRVNFYNDVTRNARFPFSDYNIAFNGEIIRFIDQMMGDPAGRTPEFFQGNQIIRDNLYTLIKAANPTPVDAPINTNRYYSSIPTLITYPDDYYTFALLTLTIGGYTTYGRPTTYGAIGPLLEDSFRHPTNNKPYFNEYSDGLVIFRGDTGTVSSVVLNYIKYPTAFNMGQESQLIDGGGALNIGSIYIATEVSEENGTFYQVGDEFTAATALLTSGQVILASNTSSIDLPNKVHETICKRVSDVMLGVTQAYQPSQFVKSLT